MAEKLKRTILFDNMKYMYRHWWEWDRRGIWYSLLRVPFIIVNPALAALIPKLLIDAIANNRSVGYLAGMVVWISALFAGSSALDPFFREKTSAAAQNGRMRYRMLAFDKMLYTSYQNIESHEGRQKFEKCKDFAFGGRGASNQRFYEINVSIFSGILGITTYFALLHRLHIFMILLILLTCLVEFLAQRYAFKAQYSSRESNMSFFMRFEYLYQTALSPQKGKEIRLYHANDWILYMMAQAVAAYVKIMRKYMRRKIAVSCIVAVVSMLREVISYGFLIEGVISGRITAADFIFYFGIVTGLSGWLMSLSGQYNDLEQVCRYCQEYREFLKMPDRNDRSGTGVCTSVPNDPQCIQFHDVSFRYSEDSDPVLSQINLTVKKGEKIAIVGENGAGKTTLIKLLCGFYAPSSGRITVDGIDISTIKEDDYFNLFSAVFQDFYFLPMDIAANITLQDWDQVDQDKLMCCLKRAEIWDRIAGLEFGLQSKMVKQVYENAVDFSGGEKQRLLLARALYKSSPILILDEPTAALDPVAENELYLKYDELMQGKTSFFISHRLSSTRFCDRILYLSEGKIIEQGSHEQLLRRQGHYWRMYETQSYYYQLKKKG